MRGWIISEIKILNLSEYSKWQHRFGRLSFFTDHNKLLRQKLISKPFNSSTIKNRRFLKLLCSYVFKAVFFLILMC